MTALAVKQLSAKEEGYFLLVEAGRIDHAHHFSNAFRALGDTVALSDAVQWAVDNVDLTDTLILVTADHSHTMTISGYPRRGNPILGTVETEPGKPMLDATGKPYTTLSYANGPGYRNNDQTSAKWTRKRGIFSSWGLCRCRQRPTPARTWQLSLLVLTHRLCAVSWSKIGSLT